MAIIPGSIPVTGFIAPTDSTDIYPVTDTLFGIDGFRNVSGSTERDSISLERRRAGMLVGTQDDQNIWKLLPAPWTQTSSDWQLFISSGATSLLTAGTTSFTASNGLTKSGNNIVLGGALTGDTFIETISNEFHINIGSSGNLLFSGNSSSFDQIRFETRFGGPVGYMRLGRGGVTMAKENLSQTDLSQFSLASGLGDNPLATLSFSSSSGGTKSIVVGESDFYIRDTHDSKGIEYFANYHANYTNRSLIDKEYVDNISSGITGSFLPLSGGTVFGNTIFSANISGNTINLTSTSVAQLIMQPVNAATPVDGSIWFTTSGGTTALNYQVSGVTKSVELT
jgi:hypothetical protein